MGLLGAFACDKIGRDLMASRSRPIDLRAEAREGIADWYAKRFSTAFFNEIALSINTRTALWFWAV